ncbi:hypothetical protein JHK87_027545 [Glycine soja]|nr:hypothetical protein JHK87_027545 [Glycine soja]
MKVQPLNQMKKLENAHFHEDLMLFSLYNDCGTLITAVDPTGYDTSPTLEEQLCVEALSLLATEDLPPLLQEEIWTFRSSLIGVYRLKWLVSVNFCEPSGLQETNGCFQQRKVPM